MTFFNAADPGLILPAGLSYWTNEDMFDYKSARPAYTRAEAGMLFFGRSTWWFKRHVLEENPAVLDGMTLSRDGRGRKYKLFHIEVIANDLVRRRIIDGRQFLNTVAMLKLQACLWGFEDEIEDLTRRAASEREV